VSDIVNRRRMLKQMSEKSNVSFMPMDHQAAANDDPLSLHIFSFDDEELADFLTMDNYLDLEIGIDEKKIIAHIDDLRSRFDKEHASYFFDETRNRLIGTVANKFMLGGIVARSDKDGGSVDTIHNARKNVNGNLIYASDELKQRYADQGPYNENVSHDYHSDKRYIEINRKHSAKREAGELVDSYTNKRFAPNDRVDLDHTISAKEIHEDPGRVLAGLDGPELANRESNLNPTDASINRSKKAQSANQFIERLEQQQPERAAKIVELKEKGSLTEQESKELRKLEKYEEIDREKLMKLDKESRKEYEAMINKSYYLSKDFIGNAAKSSVREGGKMGLQQVLGLFLTEAIAAVFDEIRDAVKKGAKRAKSFWNDLKDRLETVVKRIVSKWREALKEGFSGMISGIFSSLVTILINAFLTTAKNLVRLIREGFFSIIKAVKLLMNPPAGMTKAQAFHEAGKIVIAALAVSVGILLEEGISTLPPMAMIRSIPVVGELLYSIVFGFMIGIVTSLALWGWDKLDLFGVKEGARHQFVMEMLEQDRQKILDQRKEWLERMKANEPERYYLLSQEISFA